MLHNRYYEDYESDFQYELRTAYNAKSQYKQVFITPNGEWFYDEPSGEYIVISVHINATQSNINAMVKQHMDLFQYPF